jgi:hypothetical protein
MGFFPSRACPRETSGPGACRGPREKGPSPISMGLQRNSRLASNARPVSRPWFLGSRIHRPARSIEPCRPPSGSDPANRAFHERLERQSPASHVVRARRLARAPFRRRPAPPALFVRCPKKDRAGGASEVLASGFFSGLVSCNVFRGESALVGFCPSSRRSRARAHVGVGLAPFGP